MILSTKYTDGSGNDIHFVFGFKGDLNGTERFFSLPEILTSPKVVDKFLKIQNIKTVLTRQSGKVLPSLLTEQEYEKEEVIDMLEDDEEEYDFSLRHLYELSSSNGGLEGILDLVNSDKEVISYEDLESLVKESYEAIENIENKNFKYMIMSSKEFQSIYNYPELKIFLQNYNDNSNGQLINYLESKETKVSQEPMKSEEDILNLYVPKNIFHSEKESYMEQLARWKNDILMLSPIPKPYGDLEDKLNALNYLELTKDLPISKVKGDSRNNFLPIQDNEKIFYEKIIQMIKEYINSYCKIKGVPEEQEDIYYSNWVELKGLIELLETYIRLAVNINWVHCYKIPVDEMNLVDLDDDDSESSAESTPQDIMSDGIEFCIPSDIRAKLETNGSKMSFESYYKSLTNLLIANKCKIFSYAEVIVKLMRWGKRKPNMLTVVETLSDGNQRLELDLNSFEPVMGEKSVQKIININGRPYTLVGYIKLDEYTVSIASEPEFENLLELPHIDSLPKSVVSIICAQQVGMEENSESLSTRLVCMDLSYITTEYRKGNFSVNGLELENSIFKVNPEFNLIEMSILDLIKFVNSTDKFRYHFLGNEENVVKNIPQDMDLSSEDFKVTNLSGFIRTLLLMSNQDINGAKVSTFFKSSSNVMTVLSSLTKHFMDYFIELKDEDKTFTSNKDFLEYNINTFSKYYTGDEIKNTEKLRNLKNKQVTKEVGKTSNFKSEKELKAIYSFKVDTIEFIVIEADKNKVGANMELIMVKGNFKVDYSKLKVTKTGQTALKNILIINEDKTCKNGIFRSGETEKDIEEMVKKININLTPLQLLKQLVKK